MSISLPQTQQGHAQAQQGTSHSTSSVSRLGLWLLRLCPLPGAQVGGVVTPLSHPQILPQVMTDSVAAENVVGVGAAITCTAKTISELPTYLHTCLSLCMCQLASWISLLVKLCL